MAEEVICGEKKKQGGKYEWICVRAPHPPKTIDMGHHQPKAEVGDHYFQAFKKPAKKSRKKRAL